VTKVKHKQTEHHRISNHSPRPAAVIMAMTLIGHDHTLGVCW